MLSVAEQRLSLAAVRSGVVGAAAVVSIVTLKAPDKAETFPTASVAVAVMLCTPGLRRLVVMPGLLYAAAVPLPTWIPSLNILTVLPASAVPVNAGVVTFVMLSVFEDPESLAAVRLGVVGALGAAVSM